MKVTIEILCFEPGEQKVIGAITHETHAIEVAAAAQSVALCAMQFLPGVVGFSTYIICPFKLKTGRLRRPGSRH